MSDTVIRVENLGKKYVIEHQQEERSNYVALRDVIANGVKSLGRKLIQPQGQAVNPIEEFWALKNVSLEIKRGDRVGIIGRNGAGKSTLLKILSRITEPTTGRISIKGRVASLLEVGTGFHPELTGKENIYLNGAILGMSKGEIRHKFDEIVAFAEVERFLDTPVKRYSSGMYVRLAFAVAAHLEPEILIVDEVLAVGDASFQKKCLGKMEDVARNQGRTVLFVSHNLGAIQKLCSRAILLHQGELQKEGSVDTTIDGYFTSFSETINIPLQKRTDRVGSGRFRFVSIDFLNNEDKPLDSISTGQKLKIKVGYEAEFPVDLNTARVSIGFKNQLEQILFSCPSIVQNFSSSSRLKKQGVLVCEVFKFPLPAGNYKFSLFSAIGAEVTDRIADVGVLEVKPGDFYGTGKLPYSGGRGVFVDFMWKCS